MEFNTQIAETFRANQGIVREPMNFGHHLVLVHVPKKDGTKRVTPLASVSVDGAWHVVGSAGGSPKHPAWAFSLRRAETVQIEVPGDPVRTLNVGVHELTGAERDEVWAKFVDTMPGFADYEKSAGDRVIPIFRLTP